MKYQTNVDNIDTNRLHLNIAALVKEGLFLSRFGK